MYIPTTTCTLSHRLLFRSDEENAERLAEKAAKEKLRRKLKKQKNLETSESKLTELYTSSDCSTDSDLMQIERNRLFQRIRNQTRTSTTLARNRDLQTHRNLERQPTALARNRDLQTHRNLERKPTSLARNRDLQNNRNRSRSEESLSRNRELQRQRNDERDEDTLEQNRILQSTRNPTRDPPSVHDMKSHFYGCCGSRLTANSTRLKHFDMMSSEYKQAAEDVKKDIVDFLQITEDDKKRMIENFETASTAALSLKVCGACGIKDPNLMYHKVSLDSLGPNHHWIVIPDEDYDNKFMNCTPFALFERNEDGDIVPLPRTFTSKDFYHVSEVNIPDTTSDPTAVTYTKRYFHIIEEAVFSSNIDPEDSGGRADFEDEKVYTYLCQNCKKCKAKNTSAVVCPDKGSEESDSDILPPPTYYTPNAPGNSIARGDDYGRILHHELVQPSTLEKLILASGRCYNVTIKVVSNGKVTERKRLHGNTICFPHAFEENERTPFGPSMVAAALGAIHVVLVGPKGERGRLEKAALRVPDLRLRPEVIHTHTHNLLHTNYTANKFLLHGQTS